MKRVWQLALLVLLVGALALALAPAGQPAQAKMRVIGSYAIPNGGRGAFPIDLPGTRVALRTFGISSNYYEFDCSTLQFVNPHYFDHPEIDEDAIGWVCWAGTSGNLGLDFRDWEHAGIGNRFTGQLLYEFPLDDELPYMYAGMADGVEVMTIISEFHGKSHFLNLSQPGFLGTVTWPEDYKTSDDWMSDFTGDYINWHDLNSYCYNSLTQTLFVPISHLGLVYWCQIDLSGGFDYATGSINCGSDPQFIIQSTDGSSVYVFDDQANEVFTVNPVTRQISNTIQFESDSVLGNVIYYQGYLYFPLEILPASQDVQRVVRLDPSSGNAVSITLNGGLIMDLDALGGSVYALQHDENFNCHLLELRASDLQLMDDIVVGDRKTMCLLLDAPSGRLVVYDDTDDNVVVVQL